MYDFDSSKWKGKAEWIDLPIVVQGHLSPIDQRGSANVGVGTRNGDDDEKPKPEGHPSATPGTCSAQNCERWRDGRAARSLLLSRCSRG